MRLSFVCACFDWSHPDLKRCGEFVPCVMAISSDSWRVGERRGGRSGRVLLHLLTEGLGLVSTKLVSLAFVL